MTRRGQMKRASRAVRVGPAHVGLGVFARRAFQRRAVITQIRGDVIDDPDYGSSYCMALDESRSLEPRAPLRFLNHSCEPNCQLVSYTSWDGDAGRFQHTLFLVAGADIASGDHLTIDYAWPARHAIPCQCGSRSCRGWIVADKERAGLLARQTHEDILEHSIDDTDIS